MFYSTHHVYVYIYIYIYITDASSIFKSARVNTLWVNIRSKRLVAWSPLTCVGSLTCWKRKVSRVASRKSDALWFISPGDTSSFQLAHVTHECWLFVETCLIFCYGPRYYFVTYRYILEAVDFFFSSGISHHILSLKSSTNWLGDALSVFLT